MSSDQRILIHDLDSKWYVWEGSCSFDYFEPPANAKVFNSEEEATKYASDEYSKMSICEGGIQRLTSAEIINGMREEIDMLRNPGYCPACGACGIDGCCSGAKCLYGDYYSWEYTYNKEMADTLYKEFPDKDKLEKIIQRIRSKYFDKYETK